MARIQNIGLLHLEAKLVYYISYFKTTDEHAFFQLAFSQFINKAPKIYQ